jgi:predicted PurR-regulated permease PerM
MEDKSFSKILKLIPVIIAIVFVLTLFIWLTIGIKQILTPTVLTIIIIAILLPFKEENRTIKILIGAIIFLYLSWFISLIAVTLVPFIIALIFSYIFNPIVTFFEKKGISRTWGTILLMVILFLVLILILLFIIPALLDEITGFINQIPVIREKIVELFDILKNRENIAIPEKFQWIKKIADFSPSPELQALIDNLIKKFEESIPDIANKIWDFITNTFSNILGFILSLLSLIIIPVLMFYMLKEAKEINEFFISLIPEKNKRTVLSLISDIDIALSNFLRGQLLVATAVGVLIGLGLYVIGIKYSLLIGIFAGVTNLIPYLGIIMSIAIALLMALFKAPVIYSIISVLIVFGIVATLENSLIAPKILGDSLHLNPLLIMLAIIIGGHLHGFYGMVFAIPAMCVLKVLFDRWYDNRNKQDETPSNKTEEKKEEEKKEKQQKNSQKKEKKWQNKPGWSNPFKKIMGIFKRPKR